MISDNLKVKHLKRDTFKAWLVVLQMRRLKLLSKVSTLIVRWIL